MMWKLYEQKHLLPIIREGDGLKITMYERGSKIKI